MRSHCKVTMIGHLGSDVEMRQTKNGTAVANFPVATNRVTQDEKGEKQEIADYHRVTAWKGLGEVCSKYLKKGSAVYIEGRLVNCSFEDKEGNRQYRTEIVAETLNMLSPKKAKSGESVAIEEVKAT